MKRIVHDIFSIQHMYSDKLLTIKLFHNEACMVVCEFTQTVKEIREIANVIEKYKKYLLEDGHAWFYTLEAMAILLGVEHRNKSVTEVAEMINLKIKELENRGAK